MAADLCRLDVVYCLIHCRDTLGAKCPTPNLQRTHPPIYPSTHPQPPTGMSFPRSPLTLPYPLKITLVAMSNTDQSPNLPNPGTELAKERNRAAEERTLMAWIRTALSLIGFGFGIDRIVAAIQQSLGDAVNPVRLTRILGLSFIALGSFAMLYAALDHREQLKRIQRNDLIYLHRHSPSLVVAYVLAVLGGVAFVGILISPFLR